MASLGYGNDRNSMNTEIKINRISIYLIKKKFLKFEQIINNIDKLQKKEINGIGTLFFGESHFSIPSWVNTFFDNYLNKEKSKLFNATSKALLLISIDIEENQRLFAIPFGYGWTLLGPGTWEERFGLKIALNILDPSSLRRIDKKSLSSKLKDTSEQLSKEGVVSDFGFDIEQDLLRSITGKTKIDGFGKTIIGKDALSLSTKVNLSNIKDLLIACYSKYICDDYKESFGWIDNIYELKDKRIIQNLNAKMIESLKKNRSENIWMAVPEIIEWDKISGFSYDRKKKGELPQDIELQEFISSLKISLEDLTIDVFNKKIYCFDNTSNEIKYQWKSFNCLYCEIQDKDEQKTFLLSNGKWYEIENNFSKKINDEFLQLKNMSSPFKLPDCNEKNEYQYNKSVETKYPSICCMDQKNISYGGGYSKIEFCDLFTNDKKIIHVKQYSGSSVLSHLFAQGMVSGELFIYDNDFRLEVNKKLPSSHKFIDTTIKPNSGEYEILYAIIYPKNKDFEIPFFSKVNLRNAKRRLETFGYNVSLIKINKI